MNLLNPRLIVYREINSGVELTKKDTLKQFEESEKKTLAKKKKLIEFKPTIKKNAANEKWLTWDDEADSFQSFGSVTDRHWKCIGIFSKQGCVKISLIFHTNDDLLSLKNDVLEMLYKQTCQFKVNFIFEFILRNCTDDNV